MTHPTWCMWCEGGSPSGKRPQHIIAQTNRNYGLLGGWLTAHLACCDDCLPRASSGPLA